MFLTVVREGSTLSASRKLGVAQPTVARRIEALENEIGLKLFERDTRGFKPTEEARSLIPLVEAIEEAAETFASKTRDLAELRPIRITAPGIFSDRVMDMFSEFTTLNPGVAFEFIPSLKVLDLSAGEADIAFRIGGSEPDKTLICRKISTAKWALFGAQSYADKFGLPKSVDDFQGHRFVTFEHFDVPDYERRWLLRHVSPDQIVKSFSEPELMRASIRAGHGLGLVNLRLAEADHTLIRCFDNIEELSSSNMMLIAPAAYRRPEVKAFTKFFAPRYAATFK
ncbi:LysR family transcriptional regulator [Sulfitobacter sp. JL08]|uniref:LysR family transcriptional regulator n=1 Tax=Sulfitobacter sp. JL08 TaxID=2070369 RepID=UPI0019623B0A|nr:LysR family transcriptional regulator [Sulfitobacter sp. JL08]